MGRFCEEGKCSFVVQFSVIYAHTFIAQLYVRILVSMEIVLSQTFVPVEKDGKDQCVQKVKGGPFK